MLGYILKRVALAVPTLLVASLVVFILMRVVPGDPALMMAGDAATTEQLAEMRHSLGIDRPYPVQYLEWLGRMVRLDLDRSIVSSQPVLGSMLDAFVVTAQIVLLATFIALLAAVPLGLLAAWRQNQALDIAVVTASVLCLSVPSFWVALLLILWFGLKLQWLPVVGYVSVRDQFATGLSYLILPVVSLVFVQLGTLLRMMRSNALEVLRLEYVTHARAKGLNEARVLLKHVLPNAFPPVLTLAGVILGSLLAGAAVIETIFTLPGLGRLMVDSIYARDYPMVQGIVLLVAVIFVVVNLLIDLLLPVFDPRLRLQ